MKSVAIFFVLSVIAAMATAAPQPGGLLGVGVASPAVVTVGSPVLAGGLGGWGSPALIGSAGIIGAPAVIGTSGLGVRTVGISGIGLSGIGLGGIGLGAGKIW